MATAVRGPQAVRSIPDYVPPEHRTLGWDVLRWSIRYLQQPDGEFAGAQWKFTQEQVKILLRWFEIDQRGRFRYRRGVVRRLKGWGKDPLGAAIALAELCGPVRFGGWATDGKPIAVQHPKPWIQVAAVNLAQTQNTMMLFEGMISPGLADDHRLDLGINIIYARGRGKIQALTSSPLAIEGGRPSLVIAAETQNWVSSNDGHRMAAAIRRNLAKSNDGAARALEINNAHLVGEDSVAERTYDAWQQADGQLVDVYYDSLEAPPVEDLSDPDELTVAIDLARGDAFWLDVERLVAEALDPVTTASDVRRFYLNQPSLDTGERWMDEDRWDGITDGFEVIPDGTDVVLAFDGSYNADSTGIVVVSIEAVPRIDVVRVWEPSLIEDPDFQVPIEDVEDTIREACRRWRVREIAADPYLWARSLQLLAKERLPVVEFPQSPSRMIPATKTFSDAIANARVRQSGHDALRRHVLNAVVKTGSRGAQIQKDSKSSPRKIDLAVCAIMGLERAMFYRGKKYEVISAWDVLAGGGDGESPEDVIALMREEYLQIMREAAEEREAIERPGESGSKDPGAG